MIPETFKRVGQTFSQQPKVYENEGLLRAAMDIAFGYGPEKTKGSNDLTPVKLAMLIETFGDNAVTLLAPTMGREKAVELVKRYKALKQT